MNFIAFLDSGANGFLFIFIPKTIALSNTLNTLVLRLLQQVPVKGYNSKKGTTVIYYLVLYNVIDGRYFYNILFLILDLGSQDFIFGRSFFDYFKLQIDVNQQCFFWPNNYPPSKSFARILILNDGPPA
jgi:hypothetical protein